MKTSYNFRHGGAVSEMAIVDTFTKLIFGEESRYSDAELRIILALRSVDDNVALDDHHEMGVYLRALGVNEMIKLVSRVQCHLTSGHNLPPTRTESGAISPQSLGV
jgi:hypothetical protein